MPLAVTLTALALLSAPPAPQDTAACGPDTVAARPRLLPTGDSVRVLRTIVFPRPDSGVGTITVEYLTGRAPADAELRAEAAAVAGTLGPAAATAGVRATLAIVRACRLGAAPPATTLARQFRFVPTKDGEWAPAPRVSFPPTRRAQSRALRIRGLWEGRHAAEQAP